MPRSASPKGVPPSLRKFAKAGPMTGPEFNRCLAAVGWSHRQLAERFGVSKMAPGRWSQSVVPDHVAWRLRAIAHTVTVCHLAPVVP